MLYAEENFVKRFNIYSKISLDLISTIYRILYMNYNENCDILVADAEDYVLFWKFKLTH